MKKINLGDECGKGGHKNLLLLRKESLGLFLLRTFIHDHSVAQDFCDLFEQAPPTKDEGYLECMLTKKRSHRTYGKTDYRILGIEHRFIKVRQLEYVRFRAPFASWLSIVDVLMFNFPKRIYADHFAHESIE